MDLLIRNETEGDYRQVEELTGVAFFNLLVTGCDEHYLIHTMRKHPDFIPELDFAAVSGNKIVGNIMYANSHLINEAKVTIDSLTFGRVSVLTEYQKKGFGSVLIQHSIIIAIDPGYKAIVIEGNS